MKGGRGAVSLTSAGSRVKHLVERRILLTIVPKLA
jgi:hypothetical protein